MNGDKFIVSIRPHGLRIYVDPGENLLTAIRDTGLGIEEVVYAPCGGKGLCGRCGVFVRIGSALPPTDAEKRILGSEKLKEGLRLACQLVPLSDLEIEVATDLIASKGGLLFEGSYLEISPQPAIKKLTVGLKPPSIEDPSSLWSQIEKVLREKYSVHQVRFDLELLRIAPRISSPTPATITLRGAEVTGIDFAPGSGSTLGLAVDLGTTKIAGYLLQLQSGITLAADGMINPQVTYGDDIMSRLVHATEDKERLRELAQTARNGINKLAQVLAKKARIERAKIEEIVVAGNTAMIHLLLELPVEQLARSPFIPAFEGALEVKAREIGIDVAKGAYVYLLPAVAGFVGGDHVAMILATRLHESRKIVLGLDIGTNTEVVVSCRGELICCSCPSGPAFEGAHIHHGMRATEGAISRVRFIEGGRDVFFETIGNGPPRGVCGSGIIDAVAEMLRNDIIDGHGILNANHPRVKKGKNVLERCFVLVNQGEKGASSEIVITQQDIGEIQLAKAAIASGIEILFQSAGVSVHEIEEVIIAGAFGTFLRIESAITIGMLPNIPIERFRQVGNAAGAGARLALVSMRERKLGEELARRIRHVQLPENSGFSTAFAHALKFPGGVRS